MAQTNAKEEGGVTDSNKTKITTYYFGEGEWVAIRAEEWHEFLEGVKSVAYTWKETKVGQTKD
jgi:hypothetical protein